ncbi:MAG: hypothetical protein GY861_00640 [bacterium]|nr:hypothetical protein [bacterium]
MPNNDKKESKEWDRDIEKATIHQLNRFSDDLRKQLVLSKIKTDKSKKETKLLSKRISSKDDELSSMKTSLSKRALTEKKIIEEFDRSLSAKESEIDKLRTLLEKEHDMNRRLEEELIAQGSQTEQIKNNMLKRVAASKPRDSEITLLKQKIAEKDEYERKITQEFNKRLGAREHEIEKLGMLLSKEESTNRKLNEQLRDQISSQSEDAKHIKESILKKSKSNEQIIKQLNNKLMEKEEEVAKLIALHSTKENELEQHRSKKDSEATYMSKRFTEKEQEIEKITQQFVDKERSDERSIMHFKKELDEKRLEIEKLKHFIVEKEGLSKKLTEHLEHQLAESEKQLSDMNSQLSNVKDTDLSDHVRKLRDHITIKERLNKTLSEELDRVKHEVSAYKQKLDDERSKLRKSENEIELEHALARKDDELSYLSRRLAEKEKEIKRITQQFVGKEMADEEAIAHLRKDSSEKRAEIEKFKHFVVEKEGLNNKLTHHLEQQVADRERQIIELRSQINTQKQIETSDEVFKLKGQLHLKEKINHELTEEIARIKESVSTYKKRLSEEGQRVGESEVHYKDLIQTLKKKHENRIKEIIEQHAEHEVDLKSHIEHLKAKVHEQQILLEEKQQEVDDAIKEFHVKSGKLLELKRGRTSEPGVIPASLKEKEKSVEAREHYLVEKENQIKEMLNTAEKKIHEMTVRESEMARKEEILLKEQDALNREFKILESAGFELKKSTDYVKERISAAEQQAVQQPIHQQEAPIPQPIETTIPEPDIIQEVEPIEPIKPRRVAKKRVVGKPVKVKNYLKKDADSFFEGERAGFSEVDEIMSVVDVALEHDESPEQIRASLVSSGYSQDLVDKALKRIKII